MSDPREARRDSEKLYNPVALNELERLEGHPESWKEYLESITGQEVDDDETIIVRNQRSVQHCH